MQTEKKKFKIIQQAFQCKTKSSRNLKILGLDGRDKARS